MLALQTLGGTRKPRIDGIIAVVTSLFIHLSLRRALLLALAGLALGAGFVHLIPELWLAAQSFIGRGSISEAADNLAQGVTEHGFRWSILGTLLVVSLIVVFGVRHWWMRGILGRSLCFIVLAGILSAGLAAIQILPTVEFASRSGRASPDALEETVAFSLHPLRLVEYVSPAIFGHFFPENSRWFPFSIEERAVWVPTLYCGFIPFALAIASMRFWSGSASTRWLTWMTFFTTWLALGKFGGLMWLLDPSQNALIDPLDVERGTRFYGNSDGLYWLAENTIPGFKQFRYPSKLLVFTSLGMALLAARGMTQIISRKADKWTNRLIGLVAIVGMSIPIVSGLGWFVLAPLVQSSNIHPTSYGPFQSGLATFYFWEAAITSLVMGLSLWIGTRLIRRPFVDLAKLSMSLVLLTAVDVGLANRWLVLTDRQSVIDEKPAALTAIDDYRHQKERPNRIAFIGHDFMNRSDFTATLTPSGFRRRRAGKG